MLSPQFTEIVPIEKKVASSLSLTTDAALSNDGDSEGDDEQTDQAVADRHEKVLKSMRDRWGRILELKKELKELTGGGTCAGSTDSLAGINNFGFPSSSSSAALGRKRKHSIDGNNSNGRKRGRPPLSNKNKGQPSVSAVDGDTSYRGGNNNDSKSASDKSISASDDGSESGADAKTSPHPNPHPRNPPSSTYSNSGSKIASSSPQSRGGELSKLSPSRLSKRVAKLA